ncbi:MAG TPA: tetratricopeptide repeat protein [Candidatus Eisenbacteria bacterium]|jgi:tetratricopeptide (TPR) repeat protein
MRRSKPRRTSPASASRSPRPGASRDAWLWLGGLLVLTFLVYLPSLSNGFTNWDDTYYVTENPLLVRPGAKAILTTPVAGNYHPLTIASLALNYRLSGLQPRSYHVLSLLLHLANTALVFLFIWMLTGGRRWTSVAVSGLFGIHPMHVESVAWIAERKDVLYALFYLAGLIGYLRYLDHRRPVWYLVALAALVLSVASKPAAVVFPITLLAVDFFRGRPFRWPTLLEKMPFVLVSGVAGLLTLHAQRAAGAITEHWSAFQKLLFACYGTAQYAAKLFAPFGLSAIYPYPRLGGDGLGPEYYLALAAVASLLPAALYGFRRSRVVLFGLAFFFINIVLVLQFFTIGGAVLADRYTYVPYIGLTLAVAWWLDEPQGRLPRGVPVRPVLAGLLLLVAAVSVVQTPLRCRVWRDSESLWNDTIRKYPHRIADAYNNRGFYYYQQGGRLEEAVSDFDEALALNARFQRAWVNKGMALAALDRGDSAQICFDRALEILPDDPDVLNDRGAIKLRNGDRVGAVADFTRAIERKPGLRDAYANRALAYIRLEEYGKSVDDSRRAIALDPGNPRNYLQHGSIAVALHQLGRDREAIPEYDEALRTAPADEPLRSGYHLYRSYSWWALGDTGRARRDAREALRLGASVDPSYLRRLGG